MLKKIALFVFAAATTLSASLATARPPTCTSFCINQYKACLKSGEPAELCREELNECYRNCNYP